MGCDRLIVDGNNDDDNEREDNAVVDNLHMDANEHKRDDDDSDNDDNANAPRTWRAMSRNAPAPSATAARVRMTSAENDDDMSDDTDLEEEMMRIDPTDDEWRRQLHVGDPIDAQNVFGNWCPALILRIADGEVQLRYLNMNDAWHRWLPIDSGQLAPPATKTRNDAFAMRLAQQIEVRKTIHGVWKEAHVVKARPQDIHVRYAGRQAQFDEWIPFAPATVAPLGEHLRHRSFAAARQLSATPSTRESLPRHRVLARQHPRYAHYQQALASIGLAIVPVDGDGNCLFRSVSHQVYGDDAHHPIVRATCMDYMESEREYFEPYVVGDMAAFLHYVQCKRRAGVWGDDPELQAMCELYDRPAEVYAYDPVGGFRKLRTFHESSSAARSRPPIRLSYYGGGHYDSLVGRDHAANCIHDVPGAWEQRHIANSRRINTRGDSSGCDSDDATTTDVVQQVAAESDRATTELAQLEQTLLLSRTEFDGMHASLDETLQLSLDEFERSNATAVGGSGTAAHHEALALRDATRESETAALQAELIANAKKESEDELMKQAIAASLRGVGGTNDDNDVDDHAFDADVHAAIQASLGVHHSLVGDAATIADGATADATDYDAQMRRALELSAQEFGAFPRSDVDASRVVVDMRHASDDDDDDADELQRAIQASLMQS